ncbi:MAG: carboxypeptidase regulatory-like domain-containing protein [Bryobacteraceae bacterium]|jgi:hypothetical protein
MRPGSFVFACILTAAPLLSQAPQQPGSVSGKVVNSVTGQAVKKAVVTLRGSNGQNSYVTGSDPSGKFQFDNVQPDKYVATAEAEGYFVALRTSHKLIAVAAQQEVSDVEVPIAPLGAISGKVLDESGQPLEEASVTAMRYDYSRGAKNLQPVGGAQTNDRGEYRMFDLQPGRYYLMAVAIRRNQALAPQAVGVGVQGRVPQESRVHSTVPEEGYAAVYYPGVADVTQTSPQELKPGAEWTGADFKLRQLPAYHIRGRVTGAAARNGGRNLVRAQPCEADGTTGIGMPNTLQASSQPDARFDVAGAVPGTYCVSVTPPGARVMAVTQMVTVKAGDVDDVELPVSASFSVSGTLVIDGTPPNPMPQLFVGLRTTPNQGVSQVTIKSDGAFQIDGMYPGAYSLMLPQGSLYAKSVLYGSQDVTNGVIPSLQPGVALTITMGTDPGEVDGTVQAGAVEAGVPVNLVAVPDGAYAARQDMQRFSSSGAGGNFSIPNLPPGDYKIFAWESDDFSDLRNRDLLKLLEGKAPAVTSR